jgi:uncharacterized protein (TIGR03435 family)
MTFLLVGSESICDSSEPGPVGAFHSNGARVDLIQRLIRAGLRQANREAVALLVFIAVVLSSSSGNALGQNSPRREFEVTSVKPGNPNNSQFGYHMQPGGRYVATNVSLKNLVSTAYAIPDPRILGGPNWLDTEKFTIEAKTPGPLPPWPESNKELNLMLQSLLEKRFKLAIHWEPKETAVYNLTVSRGGPKLKQADPAERPNFGIQQGRFRSSALPLEYLASNLAYLLARPVLDKTGLTGKYDFTLVFAPELLQGNSTAAAGADVSSPSDAPSLPTALQEQLGLRLEAAKAPVDYLVVDHAEKPDAN